MLRLGKDIKKQQPFFLKLHNVSVHLNNNNNNNNNNIIIIMMSPKNRNCFILLLVLDMWICLGMTVKEDMQMVATTSGADCSLQCTAKSKDGVQYMAVRWYKVEDMSNLSGLLSKDLPEGATKYYSSLDRDVQLLSDSRTIYLTNLTCADTGVYSCQLAAPVGEQNREGHVLLKLTDCPDESTEKSILDTYLVVIAMGTLLLALVIFFMSYKCLLNTIRERNNVIKKETLLNAPLKPLEKKDLQLIYTLGPKTATMKHVCV